MSTDRLLLRAPAKLNLTFEITGLLPDGYHEVATLLQAVDLEDRLVLGLERFDGQTVRFAGYSSANGERLCLDSDNLICRAARLFLEAVPAARDWTLLVELHKEIPLASGMAGGSADAAATLAGLNTLHEKPLSPDELEQLAARLGADVPFSLRGGTATACHRGDRLSPVAHQTALFFTLFKPTGLSISTPEAFRSFDRLDSTGSSGMTAQAARALQQGDLTALASCLVNDLEQVVAAEQAWLDPLLERMVQAGALGARMTGSGPTVYALSSSKAEAAAIKDDIMELQRRGEAPWLDEAGPLAAWVAGSVGYGATADAVGSEPLTVRMSDA